MKNYNSIDITSNSSYTTDDEVLSVKEDNEKSIEPSSLSLSLSSLTSHRIEKIGIFLGVIFILSLLVVTTKPSFLISNNTTTTTTSDIDETTIDISDPTVVEVIDDNNNNDDDDPDFTPFASVETDNDNMTVSLYRTGYETLDFFTKNKDWRTTTYYKHLENYDAIIEPYVPMSLYIDGSKADDGFLYYYKICKYDSNTNTKSDCSNNGQYSESKEKTITTECKPFEEYYIYAEEYNTEKVLRRAGQGIALCQYVRREIRSLTSDDLNKAMDAMYTLWSVSEEDGKALYGDKYHSSTYFTEAHTFNAGQQDADHIHEGLGFLPQHIKMTNMFEESIQAVDPSFAIPYWDFTIDSEEGLDLDESPMFTVDTFGTIKYPTNETWGWTYRDDSLEGAAIPDGRWKQQPADINSRYAFPGNSFGYMRAPWNLNPSPYISRFSISTSQLPTCSSYYSWLELTSLPEFLSLAPYGPHASVHGAVGSVFGCDILDQMMDNGAIPSIDTQMQICRKWGFIIKELYRANAIYPRSTDECSYTSLDYDGISCGYTCPTDDETLNTLKETLNEQFKPFDVVTNKLNIGLWVNFVCSGDAFKIYVGDHLESASPSDPSFWPVHPNQERLLQLKYASGGFQDNEWPSDAESVCDKDSCYESRYGTKDAHVECCYGHYSDDQLLNFVDGDVDTGYGPTNSETMAGTDSTSTAYSMTYIYDDYLFSHCGKIVILSDELMSAALEYNSTD